MADQHWSDRMSQYLDGELSDAERVAADAHFLACDACRQQRDDFDAIREWAGRKPAPAKSDPWPAIARNIAATRWSAGEALRWAAAILLPVAIGAGLWLTSDREREASAPTRSGRAAVQGADEGLRAELEELEARFRLIEARLDPRTAAAVRSGLSELDAALTRAEEELARNRDSALLGALVARAQRQKVRLLRSITES